MADTINIASRLPVAVRLVEPMNTDMPGLNGVPAEHVIAGKSHPDGGDAVTRGVDPALFKKWRDANQNHPWLVHGHLYEVSDEDADGIDNPEMQYGWEPGLQAHLDDGENSKLAGEGVKVDEARVGLRPQPDMNAYTDGPYTDSARSAAPGEAPSARVVHPVPQQDGIDDLASGRAKLPARDAAGGAAPAAPPAVPESPPAPKQSAPEPSDVHDETFRESFKDHAGQEAAKEEPTLRGKTKGEVEGK